MNNKKIVAGILTGVAAGVAISLVLSSKKGREAGKKILRGGNQLKEDLKSRFNDFIDQIQDKSRSFVK